MTRKNSNILLPYQNKWVALSSDGEKVLASAPDAGLLSKKLMSLKIKRNEAIMSWVPRANGWYSP